MQGAIMRRVRTQLMEQMRTHRHQMQQLQGIRAFSSEFGPLTMLSEEETMFKDTGKSRA